MKFAAFCSWLLLAAHLSAAQSSSIKGSVLQADGKPIAGASIQLLNTTAAATSGQDGRFMLPQLFPGQYVIAVSAIGFAGRHKTITVTAGEAEVSFVLPAYYRQLEEVVVAAQKKEEPLQQAALSVTALGSRKAEDYRLWNAKELTAISPGLFSANPGDNRNVTSIRGIVSTSYEQAVATYVDGVNQFSLDTYIPDLFDIERIEVLRGPQGTLYGRNAMGGVINIITRKPGNTTAASAQLTVGNYGLQRYTAALKLPVVKDKLYFGAGALSDKLNGYFTNKYDNSHYDRRRSAGGNYYLRYLPAAQWEIAANVKHLHHRNRGAFPLVIGVQQAFDKPFELNQNAVTDMVDDLFNASVSVKYAGRNVSVTSQTAYQSNHRYYKDPIDADFSPLDAVSIINNYGRDWNRSAAITQEFIVRSSGARALSWSAGAYLFHQDNPVYQSTRFGEDAQLIGSPDKNYLLKNITKAAANGAAVYGELNYRITPALKITGGLRYDRERRRQDISGIYENDLGASFPFRTDTGAAVTFSSVSPRLGIAWQATEDRLIFLNYSRGYRAGGLTPLSSDPSQPALFPFDAEFSSGIEAGMKNSFAEQRVIVNIAAFYTIVRNAQVPTLVLPDAVTITRNTGRLASKGVEAEVQATLWKKLQAAYSFGYCDARYKELNLSQNGGEADLAGKRQLFTPGVTSMLAMQCSQELDKAGSTLLILRGEWKLLGAHYFDLANTIRQQAYSLFNARAGVRWKKIELAAWARNIANKKYIDYGYDFGAVHLGEPSTWGISLSVRK